MDCNRLNRIFDLLKFFFCYFNIRFTKQDFILGFFYSPKQKSKCHVINFIVGQAKYAIYVTRRNKIEKKSGQNVVLIFKNMVKARILIDFNFHRLMSMMNVFEIQWCCSNLCSVVNGKIIFIRELV